MNIVKAVLVKRATEDGMIEILDGVPLGKEYNVDLDTRDQYEGYNFEKDVVWVREMIWDVDAENWLPTEILKLPEG